MFNQIIMLVDTFDANEMVVTECVELLYL